MAANNHSAVDDPWCRVGPVAIGGRCHICPSAARIGFWFVLASALVAQTIGFASDACRYQNVLGYRVDLVFCVGGDLHDHSAAF